MTHPTIRSVFYSASLILLLAPFTLTAVAGPFGYDGQQGDRKAFREAKRAQIQSTIDSLDTDEDGRISKTEFLTGNPPQDRFENADSNGDGALTLEEMQQHQARQAKTRLEEHFASLDADGDGMVTRTEMQEQMFNRLDRDEDGYISVGEFRPLGQKGHRHARKGRSGH